MTDVEGFARQHLKCDRCAGRGYRNQHPRRALCPQCDVCSGTGIDPAARQALEALIAGRVGPLVEALDRLVYAVDSTCLRGTDEVMNDARAEAVRALEVHKKEK